MNVLASALQGRLSVLELDTTDDDSVAKLSSSLGDECSIDVLVCEKNKPLFVSANFETLSPSNSDDETRGDDDIVTYASRPFDVRCSMPGSRETAAAQPRTFSACTRPTQWRPCSSAGRCVPTWRGASRSRSSR